ncbi:MAG: thioredoxin domain-containing protein [Bdellovibrionia bacterium]
MSNVEFRKKYFSWFVSTGVAVTASLIVITACTDSAKAKPNFVHKNPPKDGVVAKIGGEEITEDKLIGDDKMDFFELKKREYELKMDRINKLMVEKLVGGEAKKSNMSLDDFITKKVTAGEVKISDKDFKQFVIDRHIPESQMNPQIKERIMSYLQTIKKQGMLNDYVAKLTKSNPVELYFNKPKMQVEVLPGTGPSFGKADATVNVVEFSDFQCPFCSRAAETVDLLKKKYGGKIKLTFRQFPLPMHKDARPASEASMCVNDQSADKFWKFHDLAFKNQDKLDKASLEKYAKDSGADVKKFNECLDGKKFADAVQKDVEYGEKIGVKSTPTFFVNGQLVSGAVPIESFSEIIDEELEKK